MAARAGAVLLVLAVTLTLVTSFTASTNVPASTAGTSTIARSIPQLAPVGCNSLVLTSLVQGSGTFSNSQSNTLVLASAGADTITDSGTGNCIVGGGGTDSVTGTSTDICISGPTLSLANPCPVTAPFGPATQVVLSASTANLVSGSTRTATATIEDAAGNTVTSGSDSTPSVTFSKASGSGTVTGLGSVAASAGVATQVVTGATVGPVGLKAAATLNGTARTSNTISFSVTAAPTITSPTVAAPENPGHNLTATFTMTGTGFENGLTVTGAGSATVNSFTWISSTSISVTATGHGASAAKGSFTVSDPDGGTVTSPNGSFVNGP